MRVISPRFTYLQNDNLAGWGQFQQHSTHSFEASRKAAFTLTKLCHLVGACHIESVCHKSWAKIINMCTSGVRRNFVGETKWHLLRQMMCSSVFVLCIKGLVKLTPELTFKILCTLKK